MKIAARIALGFIVAVAVLLAPVPAQAVQPNPAPVTPAQDVPSRVVRMAQTGSGTWSWADVKGYEMLRAMSAPSTQVATIPKPITAPATVARGAASTNILGGFFLGWGITDGALAAYGAATGDNPLQGACSQAQWVQVAVSVAYMMSAPDCTGPVVLKEGGEGWVGGSLSYGSFQMSMRFASNFTASNGQKMTGWCYGHTGATSLPAGSSLVRTFTPPGTVVSGYPTGCTSAEVGTVGVVAVIVTPQTATAPRYGVRSSGGTILAETTPGSLVSNDDKTRTPRCEISWRDGTKTLGYGTPYTENGGLPLTSSGLGCEQAFVSKPGAGPDLLPERISVGSQTEDGAITEISQSEVPDFTETEKKGLDAGDGSGLKLWKITNGTKSSCMTWAADCSDWWTKTNGGTSEGSGTEKFRCEFGGKTIDLIECGIYRNTFDTKTDTPTITDPVTGEDVDWTSTTKGDLNSTDPATSLSPGDKCFSEWSSVFNPIEWVMHPVYCAIVKAFVPRPSKVDDMGNKLDQKWRQSAPGQLASSIAAIGTAFTALGDGSCSGIPIQMPDGFHADGSPRTSTYAFMNACPGTMLAPFAAAMYWVCTGSILILGGISLRILLDKFVNNS